MPCSLLLLYIIVAVLFIMMYLLFQMTCFAIIFEWISVTWISVTRVCDYHGKKGGAYAEGFRPDIVMDSIYSLLGWRAQVYYVNRWVALGILSCLGGVKLRGRYPVGTN